ncbi:MULTISPECIES: TetR/AcrR family transcriptional regulator [unclassified Agrococcus]|uniref:TetR/AcrR family transcriptional regulator n=1 Tax=unclassified Agrococcus TaxID=2615065 RepID=UPI00362452F6
MTIEERAASDLRERRRSQTRSEIAEAALDLFERQGVASTTVEDIAAAAGISPRTFYRLCGTKEQAVLDDGEIAGALADAADAIDASMPLRPQLVAFWRERMADLEADVAGHHRHLRVRRLIADEPGLLAAALRQEHGRDEAFVAALVETSGRDPLHVRALVEWLSVLIRLSIEEWLRVADAGDDERLQTIYDRALTALQGCESV